MPRFFIDHSPTPSQTVSLYGEDARHIARSLRMHPGDPVTLCDAKGHDFLCVIASVSDDCVTLDVRESVPSQGEPSLFVTLYQCLPKTDKMDAIAQKFVEAGGGALVPVVSKRCVSRPEEKSLSRKIQRWQKIAEEAAKQCKRGKIPEVLPALPLEQAVLRAQSDPNKIFFYEGGGTPLRQLLQPDAKTLSIFIGPEGGFEPGEVEFAKQHGFSVASMGPRIFRTETAPIAALSAIMFASGNF